MRSIVIVILLGFICPGVCRAEWLYVAEGDDKQLYIDSDIGQEYNGYWVWVKEVYSSLQYNETYKVHYDTALTYWFLSKNFRKLCLHEEVDYYNGERAAYYISCDNDLVHDWINIVPETTGAIIRDVVRELINK